MFELSFSVSWFNAYHLQFGSPSMLLYLMFERLSRSFTITGVVEPTISKLEDQPAKITTRRYDILSFFVFPESVTFHIKHAHD